MKYALAFIILIFALLAAPASAKSSSATLTQSGNNSAKIIKAKTKKIGRSKIRSSNAAARVLKSVTLKLRDGKAKIRSTRRFRWMTTKKGNRFAQFQ